MPKNRSSVMNPSHLQRNPKGKGGRPDEGRCKPVTVRFTEFEHQQLLQAVQETGKSASDLIRLTAAGIEIKPRHAPITYDLLKELTAWGNNINQIAYKCNSGGPVQAEILDLLTQYYNALARIELRIQKGGCK